MDANVAVAMMKTYDGACGKIQRLRIATRYHRRLVIPQTARYEIRRQAEEDASCDRSLLPARDGMYRARTDPVRRKQFDDMHAEAAGDPGSGEAADWMRGKGRTLRDWYPGGIAGNEGDALARLNKEVASDRSIMTTAAAIADDAGIAYLLTFDNDMLAFFRKVGKITDGRLRLRLPDAAH